MPIRLIIADDHAVCRSGLKVLLEKEKDMKVVHEAGTGTEALKLARSKAFDVLLLDINMPEMSGIMVAEKVLQEQPDRSIVILTMHDDEHYLQELFKIGIHGFVLKKSSDAELLHAIRVVHRGEKYIDPSLVSCLIKPYIGKAPEKSSHGKDRLTPREQEICSLLAYGYTNSELAAKLGVSERTVEFHRANIFSKLHLKSRAELVQFAIENSLMQIS